MQSEAYELTGALNLYRGILSAGDSQQLSIFVAMMAASYYIQYM